MIRLNPIFVRIGNVCKREKYRFLALLPLLFLTAVVNAGDIIPGIDDSAAVFDQSALYNGSDSIPAIEGETGGYITFAARFTASSQDLSASDSGAVVILECGGTSYGSGLYICSSNIVFATKGSSGVSGNSYVQTDLNDTDVSDNAAAVTLGVVQEGTATEVFASLDAINGVLTYALNGEYGSVGITGTSGTANLSGNESVTFLAPVPTDPGWLGGMTNSISVSNPLLDAYLVTGFTGVSGEAVRGQIFAIPAPENVEPYSIVVSKTEVDVQEGGYTDSVSITLSDNPGSYPVTVRFTADDSTQLTPAQVEYTFDTSNWESTWNVNVSAVDDSLREARYHETIYNIEVITDIESQYYGFEIEPVTIEILENDCGTWAGYTEGDFNNDCQVDIQDLYLFALEWMDEL